LFETGIKDAIQVGIITAKFLFKQIKDFISNPGKSLDDLRDFGAGLVDVVSDTTGKALTYLFRSVHSIEDMLQWVKSYKLRNVCLSYIPAQSDNVLYAGVGLNSEFFVEQTLAVSAQEFIAQALLGGKARAADITCFGLNLTDKLVELANDTARFGDFTKAGKVADSVREAANVLKSAGLVLSSQRAIDVLAELAARDKALVEAFAKNAAKGFTTKNGYFKLYITDTNALDVLLDTVGKVPSDVDGYAKWIAKIGVEHSFAIKGIAGEAQAVVKVGEKYADKSPQLVRLSDRIDEPFENLDEVIVRGNVKGVDAIFDLSDGGKLFVESKVLNATSATEKEVLDRLEKQFFKHLETRVLPLIKYAGDGSLHYVDGMPAPILDYHLAGSWFTPDRVQKILDRFGEIINDPRLEWILSAEPKFQFTTSNVTLGDAIPAIIQAAE